MVEVDGLLEVGVVEERTSEAADKVDRRVDRREDRDRNGGRLVGRLPRVHLLLEERVALLLDVKVDDARELLLPDLEAVNVDVVLNVCGWWAASTGE